MVKTIGIGKQDFASVIEDNCFFVDKTSFIKEWWDSKDDVDSHHASEAFWKNT